MAEYVVKGAEKNETVLHSRTPNGYEAWHWLPVLERIVRCRDCKRVTLDQGDHDYREPLWCGLFHIDVSLDGFCKWGVRRGSE